MISLKNISNAELVSRMEKLVQTERKITHLILQYILEIEDRKLYAEMGYDEMYTYLTRGLGYSEGSAYRRLKSAHLLREVPDISIKLEKGSLNLSQLTQLQKCIKEKMQKTGEILEPQKTLQVLEMIQSKNTFETTQILAMEFDQKLQIHEKVSPQKDSSVRIELTLSEDQFKELEQAKSFLSHICPDGKWSDVISTLAKIYNDKKIKGRSSITQTVIDRKVKGKAEIVEDSINTKNNIDTGTAILSNTSTNTDKENNSKIIIKRPRRYISLKTKRLLLEKAGFHCEFHDPESKLRCSSRYQLQIDHVKPWSLGGSNSPENLRVLCRKHNIYMAKKFWLNLHY